MATMDIDRDVAVHLQKAKTAAPPELREFYTRFEDLYDKKLWHQLTLALFEFTKLPASRPVLVDLYNEFVVDWMKKMNQLSLIQFVSVAVKAISDPTKALEFVQAHVDRLKDNEDHLEAYTLALTESARLKLIAGDLKGTKEDLDTAEKKMDALPGTEMVINANFYRVAADYYKAKAMFPQYYKNALLFLSSVNLEDIPAPERYERAYDLAISALLGEGIYSFGELLMHPVLDALKDSPTDWLRQLLFCFNRGDNDLFEKISKHPEFLKTPLLVSNLPFLNQKLCLMALIESVFRRDKVERGQLTFAAISKDTRVPVEEVEHLIMKALSIGLVKGSIDEITKTMSWVQPRVLDKGQISAMRDMLTLWSENIVKKVHMLETQDGADEVFLKHAS